MAWSHQSGELVLSLPSSWRNISGLDGMSSDELAAVGWSEVDLVLPAIDPLHEAFGALVLREDGKATCVVVAAPVPSTVPNANLRVALRELGLLPLVKAKALEAKAAANAIDPTDDGEFWERWEYGNFIGRNDGFVLQMQFAFGKTDAQMDAIFRLAATK
jgi:hypothetical protein